ncbi:sugar phosphate nucleotidyltransferase [Pigmentibacter sp. JX0631]|uniref:nucleotidyltransferase family protein n=1 Tax=Pigmentibacter sp. JX0631 TaxID=2976982 RepID=UPI002469B002|nr:sugar phosphate nucleotidyltransferase [Pigmentibacter sp. JX0631]WGL61451.1 sugar phosphate nucleotidyltransferase [Pigmentibacter sp. JX0631]
MNYKIENEKYIPIVLCAGFGTRLKPLTNYLPKVTCPIIDKPVAFLSIEIFLKAGFKEIHCNTHYLSEQVKEELIKAAEYHGYNSNCIKFWHENDLLDTGGGITRIYKEVTENSKLKRDAIVVSGDIAADFPLKEMIFQWEQKKTESLALMATKKLNYTRKDATWLDKTGNYIVGFGENYINKNECISSVFTTHQIISHKILEITSIEKSSSINLIYRKILEKKLKIMNFNYPENNYWFDIGTPIDYLNCINFFSKIHRNFEYLNDNLVINFFHSTIPEDLKNNLIPLKETNIKNKVILKFKSATSNNLFTFKNSSSNLDDNYFYFII